MSRNSVQEVCWTRIQSAKNLFLKPVAIPRLGDLMVLASEVKSVFHTDIDMRYFHC